MDTSTPPQSADIAVLVPVRRSDGTTVHAKVSAEDVGRVMAETWHLTHDGYAKRYDHPPGETPHLHRFVMDDPKGLHVHHVNHDRLDCRRSNLRAVTAAENARHRKGANANSSTGVRNVYRNRQGKYVVSVRCNYRAHHGGTFETLDEAEVAAATLRQSLGFTA